MSLRDTILAAKDTPAPDGPIAVQEWGCDVYLRVISGAERIAFQDCAYGEEQQSPLLYGLLLCRALCDKDGKRIFGDNDAAALAGRNALVLRPLFLRAHKLNRLGADGVEQAVKNSDASPSA